MKTTLLDWPAFLKEIKEKLAKVLWDIPSLPEGEKEMALKEFLWGLDQIQARVQEDTSRWENADRISREENEILRSLLGTQEQELRARVLTLAQEISQLRKDLLISADEGAGLKKKTEDLFQDNEDLRR